MKAFVTCLRKRNLADRTVFNTLEAVHKFLKDHKVQGLPRSQWPRYTEKIVSAYGEDELTALFAASSDEDRLVWQFFAFSGGREQEVMTACYRDVSFPNKTFTVHEKPDLHFKPKDREERVIPLPDKLVEALQVRRRQNPEARLIFANAAGQPEGHFLRRLKKLALRAGLNCGQCVSRKGLPCQTHPVCQSWNLHRFRKSFATLHHEAGVSARTLQSWLGHSDLETTLAYLQVADLRSDRTRDAVNKTFAAIA